MSRDDERGDGSGDGGDNESGGDGVRDVADTGGGGADTGGGGADTGEGRVGGRGAARDSPRPDEQYCSSCGEVIKKQAEICPECGVRQSPAGGTSAPGDKDRTTAGILAILLGGVGAHKFYLGETGLGILYLCFFWTFIPALVGLIEGILYLTKTDEEFQRQYVQD